MIGHALDGDVPPANADDAFDDTDIDVAFLENCALFDVQLDEGFQLARLAPRLLQVIRIAAHCANALTNRLAAVAHDVECLRWLPPGHRQASDQPAFLVGETHDFQRMEQTSATLAQGLRDLDRTQHADIAVIVAAARNGVDVRPDHDHWELRINPLAPADDVAGRVDVHDEPGILHQFLDVLAARDIRRAEGDATDASFGVGAEFREFGDVLLQPLLARGQHSAFTGSEQRCQGGAEEYKESEVSFLRAGWPHVDLTSLQA